MDRIKKLKDERGQLAKEMLDLHEKSKAENRSFSKEEKDQWARMTTDLDAKDEDIKIAERAEALLSVSAVPVAEQGSMSKDEAREKSNRAWQNYFLNRGGKWADFTEEDRRTLENNPYKEFRTNAQSLTDGKGGYTIPTGFSNELTLAKLAWGGVEGVSRVIRTDSGNDIEWPLANDTAVVAYKIAEATDHGTSATDVTFTQKTLKSYKYTSGLVRVSRELIQDSYFNFQTLLADLFGYRIGRGLNAAFTTGAGTTDVAGVVTGATSSGVTVDDTTLSYANLIDLYHSVDPAYQINGKFMFKDSTLAAIRKLEDTEGHLIWQPDLVAGIPATVLGKPYVINQDMAAIGANNKSVLFGDFSNYVIRYAGPERLVVLNERYAEYDQIGMFLNVRVDAMLMDAGTHPVKYLVHASS
jgi:HK97 family phage major capsid protein